MNRGGPIKFGEKRMAWLTTLDHYTLRACSREGLVRLIPHYSLSSPPPYHGCHPGPLPSAHGTTAQAMALKVLHSVAMPSLPLTPTVADHQPS